MNACSRHFFFFFFNDTATTEIYTLSLHDALPTSTSSRDRAAAPGIAAAPCIAPGSTCRDSCGRRPASPWRRRRPRRNRAHDQVGGVLQAEAGPARRAVPDLLAHA